MNDPIDLVTEPIPDIHLVHGDLEITLMGDCEGIVPWLEPDEKGMQRPPTSENFDDFLAVVTSAEDQRKIIDAIEGGRFKPAARFEAAKKAWRNSMRIADSEKLISRLNAIHASLAAALGDDGAKEAIAEASEEPAGVPFGT